MWWSDPSKCGEGTELYRGVGIIVMCGLWFSTLISLTFLPALLVTVLKSSRAKKLSPTILET